MIGFRVDANEEVALGHMMRCISIAVECQKQGEECVFFLAEEKETERLQLAGFKYFILNTDWKKMEEELPFFEKFLKEKKVDYLVVDSYRVTPMYLKKINAMVKVLYIDDLKKERYDVSAILHYIDCIPDMFYKEKYKDSQTVVLDDMKYAPLREEFQISEKELKREKSILITTGGTDTYNVAGRIAELCQQEAEIKDYKIDIIVGNMNQHQKQLEWLACRYSNISLHKNISNISTFMRRSELAISAGGTTLLELCVCKIPTICFSFADNQLEFAQNMGKIGAVIYVGDVREKEKLEEGIIEQMKFLIQNDDIRNRQAKHMESLVDGKGASRIAKLLCLKKSERKQEERL